jgi:hypothetical protein
MTTGCGLSKATKPDPAPQCTPTTRIEYRTPPASDLVDVEEPQPTAETIGAKLENRIDLRAAFRTLRSHMQSIREWAAKAGGAPETTEGKP